MYISTYRFYTYFIILPAWALSFYMLSLFIQGQSHFRDGLHRNDDEDTVAPGEENELQGNNIFNDDPNQRRKAPEAGPKVDSLQKRMLAMSGQDVDAYMKEMEEVHRQTQAEKDRELQSR